MCGLARENKNRYHHHGSPYRSFRSGMIAISAIVALSFSGNLYAQDTNKAASEGKRYYSENSEKADATSTSTTTKSKSKARSKSTKKRAKRPLSYYDFQPNPIGALGNEPVPMMPPPMAPTPAPAWRGMIWPQGSPCSPAL